VTAGSGQFRSYDLRQMFEKAHERHPFLVDHLVCSNITLVYGEPFSGKSTLATLLAKAALLNETFLDRPINKIVRRVVILTTELDGIEEYGRRLEEAGVPPEAGSLTAYEVSSLQPEGWTALASVVGADEHTLVILDNLTGITFGSLNEDFAVRAVFDGLRGFTAHGAAVVVLAHVSEKSGQHGKSNKPMGSTAISAGARWRVRLDVRRDVITLTCDGNGAKGMSFTLQRGDRVTDLRLVSQVSAAEKDVAAATRDMERCLAMAQWVVANCQDLSITASGHKLGEHGGFGITKGTGRDYLTGTGAKLQGWLDYDRSAKRWSLRDQA
jgi:hypothetical protein